MQSRSLVRAPVVRQSNQKRGHLVHPPLRPAVAEPRRTPREWNASQIAKTGWLTKSGAIRGYCGSASHPAYERSGVGVEPTHRRATPVWPILKLCQKRAICRLFLPGAPVGAPAGSRPCTHELLVAWFDEPFSFGLVASGHSDFNRRPSSMEAASGRRGWERPECSSDGEHDFAARVPGAEIPHRLGSLAQWERPVDDGRDLPRFEELM